MPAKKMCRAKFHKYMTSATYCNVEKPHDLNYHASSDFVVMRGAPTKFIIFQS